MLKQMLLGTALVAFGLGGSVNAQEPADQAQPQLPSQKRALQVRSGHSVADFTANFDRASRTLRPSPLAPGSAEVP
jgi:hypothetical protein